jgi:hypothetical protein
MKTSEAGVRSPHRFLMAEVHTQSSYSTMSTDRERPSASAELEKLRKELLQRIVQNEARRVTASRS